MGKIIKNKRNIFSLIALNILFISNFFNSIIIYFFTSIYYYFL